MRNAFRRDTSREPSQASARLLFSTKLCWGAPSLRGPLFPRSSNWRCVFATACAPGAPEPEPSNGFGTSAISARCAHCSARNNMGLKFSIVIPNYNSGPVLERALRSLVSQHYPDLQLILIDAGSTDASREIIERYRPHLDTVVIEKDNGQADALNKGFARATGDVFGWLCADDELLPGALHHAAEIFSANPQADVFL